MDRQQSPPDLITPGETEAQGPIPVAMTGLRLGFPDTPAGSTPRKWLDFKPPESCGPECLVVKLGRDPELKHVDRLSSPETQCPGQVGGCTVPAGSGVLPS